MRILKSHNTKISWFCVVNGHVESDYSVNTSRWSEPRFIQDPFLRIHGLAPGLNYGTSSLIQEKRRS